MPKNACSDYALCVASLADAGGRGTTADGQQLVHLSKRVQLVNLDNAAEDS